MELDKSALKVDELKYFAARRGGADAVRVADNIIIAGVTLLNYMLEDISASKKSGAEAIVVGLAVSMP